jgi:hypothetical protein
MIEGMDNITPAQLAGILVASAGVLTAVAAFLRSLPASS